MVLGESAAARLRLWAASVRGKYQRQPQLPEGGRPSSAETLARLVALVRDTAKQFSSCLELFRGLHGSLARGVQDFLIYDSLGLDEHAMGLLKMCLTLFQECEPLLKGDGLQRLSAYWDLVAEDCEHISSLLRTRDEAQTRLRHYEEKVAKLKARAGLPASDGDSESSDEKAEMLQHSPASAAPPRPKTDKLSRNLEKLARAKSLVESNQEEWASELQAFEGRRAGHARALLLGFLGTYMRLLGDFGGQAAEAAEAVEGELRPGSKVRVLGLPGSKAGGAPATLEEAEDGNGRCVVSLQDGTRTAVRPESVCPSGPAEVSVEPTQGPRHAGCLAEVRCGGLDGPVSEVLVNGKHVEVLSATCWGARVRLPPVPRPGPASVEVRAARWRQRVAVAEAGFRYYESIGFGPHGKNIQLADEPNAPPGVEAAKTVAARVTGLLDGVVLTSAPLLPIFTEGLPQVRYYYEFEVLETAQRVTGTTRTLSLGFAWHGPPPERPVVDAAGAGCFQAAQVQATGSSAVPRVPDMARSHPLSFVVGGDLPRVYVATKEISKVSSGWRPLFDVGVGSVLGVMLQVQLGSAKLVILQDGSCRCSMEAQLPSDDARWSGPPHGVIDVCGTVQRVALRQGAEIPRAALEMSCQAADTSSPRRPQAQRRSLSVDSAQPEPWG